MIYLIRHSDSVISKRILLPPSVTYTDVHRHIKGLLYHNSLIFGLHNFLGAYTVSFLGLASLSKYTSFFYFGGVRVRPALERNKKC
jgi:hypothetical protein